MTMDKETRRKLYQAAGLDPDLADQAEQREHKDETRSVEARRKAARKAMGAKN
jgi:hypothetical protein